MSVTVISHVAEVKGALDEAMRRAAMVAGGIIEGKAKELCPVKTGNLRNSIGYALGGGSFNGMEVPADSAGEVTVYVGTGVQYAPYVELGHNQEPGRYVPKLGKRLVADHVAAKPFLRPAVESSTGELEQAIKSAIG